MYKKPIKKSASKSSTTKSSKKVSSSKVEEPIKVEQPVNLVVSEEEKASIRAAIKIQSHWRIYCARKTLAGLRVEKREADEKLRRLEHEAYLQAVKLEQDREEREFHKRLKEEATKRARETWRRKFLEAAYEGNLAQLEFDVSDFENELNADPKLMDDEARKRHVMLHELIDCADPNGNTPLSEAAAGGSPEVVRFLLSKGADPNSRGAFGRTPLWRSSFAGHLNCVQILLENGSDPRLYSIDGQRCIDAATQASVIDVLTNWNVKLTDRMLAQIAKTRLQMAHDLANSLDERKRKARAEFTSTQSQFEQCKVELFKCNCELKQLHDEYLTAPDMYAPLIEAKETQRVEVNARYESLRERMVKARIAYKDFLSEFRREKKMLMGNNETDKNTKTTPDSNSSDSESDEDVNDKKVLKINIREMDDIIMRDLNDTIKTSNKWPLIIDTNEQAATFLRYRDTNYINALSLGGDRQQCERFRLALIGAIRYGKPFVIDLMQYDGELLESIRVVCEQIGADLFELIHSKRLVVDENYMKFVRVDVDGKEYEAHHFTQHRINNFKVLFLTSNPYPCKKLIGLTMPIKIVNSSKPLF